MYKVNQFKINFMNIHGIYKCAHPILNNTKNMKTVIEKACERGDRMMLVTGVMLVTRMMLVTRVMGVMGVMGMGGRQVDRIDESYGNDRVNSWRGRKKSYQCETDKGTHENGNIELLQANGCWKAEMSNLQQSRLKGRKTGLSCISRSYLIEWK